MRLVLLPGMDGTGRLYAPFVQALRSQVSAQSQIDIAVLDYPIHQALGYLQLLPIVEQRMRAFIAANDVVLVAESFAGPLAIMLLAQWQERGDALSRQCAGLVLCNTFTRSPTPYLEPLTGLAGLLPMHTAPDWALRLALLGTQASDELVAQVRESILSVPVRVLQHRLQEVMRIEVSQQMASLNLPCLVLSGKEDRLVPQACVQELARFAQQATLKQIVGPHALFQAQPQYTADVVLQWLSGL